MILNYVKLLQPVYVLYWAKLLDLGANLYDRYVKYVSDRYQQQGHPLKIFNHFSLFILQGELFCIIYKC